MKRKCNINNTNWYIETDIFPVGKQALWVKFGTHWYQFRYVYELSHIELWK